MSILQSLARNKRSLRHICALVFALCAGVASPQDLSSTYQWKPVRIGGGGYVVGMVLHPLNPAVRYLRTDVGNAYRWDAAGQQWAAMRVSSAGLSAASFGVLGPDSSAPASGGEESIAVDPANVNTVYMVFPTVHSCDVKCPTNYDEIYKSTDAGLTFTPGNMTSAAVLGNANGSHRYLGERLAVDPANSQVLYYATSSQGLFRSMDGGSSWSQFSGASAPPGTLEFVNVQFGTGSGTIAINGVTVSKTIYAVSINNNGDSGGDVYQSTDGGQSWSDISTGVVDAASGESLSKQALTSSMDAAGILYIPENAATNGYHRAYWRYAGKAWSRVSLEAGGAFEIAQPVASIAVDPAHPQRIYALGLDTGMSRSDDGGTTWTSFGEPLYANHLGWLPQTIGMAGGEWHSNGGLKMDSLGNLWTPTGQEGPLTMTGTAAAAGTAANPPMWTIMTSGVEEMVSQDLAIPPGSNDTIVAMAADTTGFFIPNPHNFSAAQIPLQQEIISQGTSVDYAPDVPSYLAVTSSNVYTNGTNYSGFSTDGGKTWTRFGPALRYNCSGATLCDIPAGTVAIGLRGSRALGSDHIVLYPPNSLLPEYSLDGGATWHVTTSFPAATGGMSFDTSGGTYVSYPFPELLQHMLRADPFAADRFYLKLIHAPSSFYVSTDGGQTWQGQPNAGLPDYTFGGQLVVNRHAKNDLWFADGFEGALTHGLFHSTDGGATFQQMPGISHACTLAIGAGSGNAGDASYSVYFYGLLASDPLWGIFRSTDGGASWQRIAFYPTGIYDRPTTMAASQDSFGKVYLGFGGNSFVYGQATTTAVLPGQPGGLTAQAVAGTEIDLTWSAPGGASVTGYNVYRGTSAGGEAATPIASAIAGTTYKDTGLTSGTTYFYQVAALSSTGTGARSSETSATVAAASLTLAAASGSQTSTTIAPGATATFQLVLKSTNVAGTIQFTCSGAPSGDVCSPPAAVTLTSASTSTPATVKITTSASADHASHHGLLGLAPWMAASSILPWVFVLGRKRRSRHLALALFLSAGAAAMLVTGCGSSSSAGTSQPPPTISFTVTVTASGPNGLNATQMLTVTVQ